jgi:hypothetical protein
MINFLAMLQVWQQQGDRLLIFMDMNELILNGPLANCMLGMGLEEAIHQHWGDIKPHTYMGGKEPIDAVFHTPDLEVTSTLQLSFHKGIGDHRTVLVDISTWSAIGKQEFQVVHPHARRLNSKNDRARLKYLRHLETQMATHKMTHCLDECEHAIQSYPSPPDAVKKMEALDKQMVEMQLGSKKQCRPIYSANLPFNKPVRTLHFWRRTYQGLLARLQHKAPQTSSIIQQAIKAGISQLHLLLPDQCLDVMEVCSCKLKGLQTHTHGLRKVHLRNCLIQAHNSGNKERYKGILRTIEREEQKSIWKQINRATDDPRLGAIPLVQWMEGTEVVDIVETEEMNAEIQRVTEQRFDLSMSASITMSSLQEKVGFLSGTKFATNLLSGNVEIPDNIDNVTGMILREIIHLFQTLHSEHQEITLGEEQFRYYWRKFKEKTSSSITKVHAGHYILAIYSDVITTFLSKKIALIARGGCPPDRWGHGLQVMLEKVAGVALVNKLRAIL